MKIPSPPVCLVYCYSMEFSIAPEGGRQSAKIGQTLGSKNRFAEFCMRGCAIRDTIPNGVSTKRTVALADDPVLPRVVEREEAAARLALVAYGFPPFSPPHLPQEYF